MDPLDLPTLAAYAGGTLRVGVGGSPTRTVREISTDSRSVGPGDLFLALRGERFDGHGYVSQVAARGALGAVVARDYLASDPAPAVVPPEFAWIEVDDTLAAYQRIAAEYRRERLAALRVVGITGSNGKTSTKDFTGAVLERGFRVLKTEGNLNNHVGVPRMVLRLSAAAHDVAVLEMGMNHPGEIAPLARIARPDVAIITNIGTAHLEFMGTRAAIAREKGMLAEALGASGTLILPAGDEFAAALAARTAGTVVTVGIDAGDLRAEHVRADLTGDNGGGSLFTVVDTRDGQRADVVLSVPGAHMVVNSLLALAAGRALGLSLAEGAAGLSTARLTPGRLERKTLGGLHFLDDSYNANPDSMTAALQTLARLPVSPGARRLAVLGRMGELGDAAAAGYRQVGERVAAEALDVLISVGPEAAAIGDAARAAGQSATHAVGTTAEAAQLLRSLARPGDLILLKGSRSAAMETVLQALDLTGGAH